MAFLLLFNTHLLNILDPVDFSLNFNLDFFLRTKMARLGFPEKARMICAPIMVQSAEQMLNGMNQAKMDGADVVEINLECIYNFEPWRDGLKLLLENKPIPVVVVVCRTSWEGDDEQKQLQALLLANDLGADYIDLDLKVASALIKENKLSQLKSSNIIVSCHLDSFTPLNDDHSRLIVQMQSTKADIIKIVSTAANITEIAHVFDFLSNSQVPAVAYCTGERGLISQLLNFKFGGAFIYGSIEGYDIPGVPRIDSLRQAYGVKNIDKDTRVFGLISKPVSHSKGPILHNPTFRHVGYNGIYVPMLVDDLKEFFDVYSNTDFAGFSVGIPYKEAIIDFCDEVHPLAQSIGAVNTIIRRPNDGKLIGYNTDCEAAISAIEDALKGCEGLHSSPLNGKLFVLVGAGGAGRALAFGAKTRGARIVVFDIDFERAKSLADAVSGEARPFEDIISFEPEKDAILANATPLGMHPYHVDRTPVPEESLRDYKLVFDAVYSPRKTRLLKEAEAAGAIVVSGVEMFLRQAAAQFSLFTTQKAPEEFMRRIILEKF
ncbi:bifunctional 3-dehydroquinate dehydratase/shikimate dehydrogenase chloroplastic [Phtheirospermum japonicum]|uniref:Bifunctional 3-dehydroquinate dehydratase/shikimate dehydrogenase chloroplastic n=1 Tax=Phtheirospermum japonicum TaxID=374723 RepID=A0A830C2W6_9LAMI|nr:bifunctional 3-dehydroquinate dehydratase/shikimate dehydrogenase chloroplastic [Phtheirospermum japonicum]